MSGGLNLPAELRRMFKRINDRLERLEKRRLPTFAQNGPTGAAPRSGIFGDGSDGVCLFNGSSTVLGLVPSGGVYTMTRDIYLDDGSEVSAGATLRTRSFRVFCTGTLTNNGTIEANGLAPVGTTGGVAGGIGGTGVAYYTTSNQDGGGGGSFGAGVKSPGNNITDALGGAGGAGGSSNAGGVGTGVAGSTVTVPTASLGGVPRELIHLVLGATAPTIVKYQAGAGGSSGSSTGSPAATGAGGGAGGICGVFALTLLNNGTISADGGAGAAATGASGNAGGGGGGGGGAVFVICGEGSTQGTMTANGGVGGVGRGTGGQGGTGGVGRVIYLEG